MTNKDKAYGCHFSDAAVYVKPADLVGHYFNNSKWSQYWWGDEDHWKLRECVSDVPAYRKFIIDLADFPRAKDDCRVLRNVEAYSACPELYVGSYSGASGLSLHKVSYFRRYSEQNVFLVNLSTGHQILTTDNSKAVYGFNSDAANFCTVSPDKAVGLYVPIVGHVAEPVNTHIYCDMLYVGTNLDLDSELGYIFGFLSGYVDNNIDSTKINTSILNYKCETYLKRRGISVSEGEFIRWILDKIKSSFAKRSIPSIAVTAGSDFKWGFVSGMMDSHKLNTDNFIMFTRHFRFARSFRTFLDHLGIKNNMFYVEAGSRRSGWRIAINKCDICVNKGFLQSDYAFGSCSYANTAVKHDSVPLPFEVLEAATGSMHEKGYSDLYRIVLLNSYSGLINRDSAVKIIKHINKHKGIVLSWWKDIVMNDRIFWSEVYSVESSGKTECGYGLSVEGADTFISSDGFAVPSVKI